MRRIFTLFLAMVLLTSFTAGCASKYGEQKTVVNYYPSCYQPIKELRKSENQVAKGTAVGAGIGALGGALLGYLATGKASGAVAGAAVGGVAGGVAGNVYASKQKERDDNRRLAMYLQDIEGDISNLDIVSASAQHSLKCYDSEFNALVADIKARRVSRNIANKRYKEIKSGRNEAIAILGDAERRGYDLQQQYDQAFVQEEQKLNRSGQHNQQARRSLNQAKTRKQNLNRSVSNISKQKAEATAKQTQQDRAMADIEKTLA